MASSEEDMNTNLLPRHPVGSDHTGRQDDRVASQTPTAPVDTDLAGETCPGVDDAATEEPEWYPPPGTACM